MNCYLLLTFPVFGAITPLHVSAAVVMCGAGHRVAAFESWGNWGRGIGETRRCEEIISGVKCPRKPAMYLDNYDDITRGMAWHIWGALAVKDPRDWGIRVLWDDFEDIGPNHDIGIARGGFLADES